MRTDACDAARLLARGLDLTGVGRLLAGGGTGSRLVRDVLRTTAFVPLARRLATAPAPEHQALAALLAAAIEAGDGAAALALVSTAGRRPDLRAEKIVSHRYRYLWLCNPKVASRSLIAALRAADPEAELIRGRTLDEVLAVRPELRDYFRFAFLRHPWHRARSFHADKHALARADRNAYRWFIAPWYGLRRGMSFAELCRWLGTACGSDAFADRHWLSQHRQLNDADGRQPDFLGRYETLEADWRRVSERLHMPFVELPRLNARVHRLGLPATPDEETLAMLRRRYAADFAVGGYGDERPESRRDVR